MGQIPTEIVITMDQMRTKSLTVNGVEVAGITNAWTVDGRHDHAEVTLVFPMCDVRIVREDDDDDDDNDGS